MHRLTVWLLPLLGTLAAVGVAGPPSKPAESGTRLARVPEDPNDWPMYNRDVIGTRHNPAEKTLARDNVGRLVEKWRFPPADSGLQIGVVHATVVVNGHVYFGTELNPTFYKLTPDGRVKWSYRASELPVNRVP